MTTCNKYEKSCVLLLTIFLGSKKEVWERYGVSSGHYQEYNIDEKKLT